MNIENNVVKNYLKNCLFINGTAYAGKSTMCKMFAEKYNLVLCEENYVLDKFLKIASVKEQPNISYFKTMKDWQEFLNRTPEEYFVWIIGNSYEVGGIEIAELIHMSDDKKIYLCIF